MSKSKKRKAAQRPKASVYLGGGCIVVGRRYSSAFLKKLQG